MLRLTLTRAAEKFWGNLPDKQFCQVYDAINSLLVAPEATDSLELKSSVFPKRRRKDVGEYRIIYHADATTLYVELIGKRNGDEVYQIAKRMGVICL